jgi:uncharacterized protein (TIGR02268 family)
VSLAASVCVVALLLGAPVRAQPQPTGAATRVIELGAQGAASALEVRVLPGTEVGIRFDADIRPGGVTVERQRERFASVEVYARTIVLVPAGTLQPGERLVLTVPFVEDGATPTQAVLTLVAHPTEADGWVRVYRQPRTAAALQAELDATHAQLVAARAEVRALREQGPPPSLTGLWRAGLLGTAGIRCGKVKRDKGPKPLAEHIEEAWTCAAAGAGLVVVRVKAPAEGAPGGEVSATLKAASGQEAHVQAVEVQTAANKHGDSKRWVWVEAALPPEGAEKPFTLELTGLGGGNVVRMPDVRFARP